MRNPQEPRDAASAHLDDEGVSECAFSPEQAAPGALEHAAGCADCSARIEELGRLLASLADLPEPEVPESVHLRLDATIERAWQEADAEAERKSRTDRRRRRFRAWMPLAVPVAALGVIVGAVAGLSALGGTSGSSSAAPAGVSAGAANGPEVRPGARAENETLLTQMASAALKSGSSATSLRPGTAGNSGTVPAQASTVAPSSPEFSGVATCAPALTGYTVAAAAPENYSGREASLVVYRNDKEPASTTTFYAVLYAGSCPNPSSVVLDEGSVSVSR